ncbi:hypothetical protein SPSIL_024600 [Sporomusa silvacetica DSM 10669]|uniref:Uncharacterized protein n=1 Tax=Sporomusa silvacetica DSM 10669 TaxID=1123289 RepID=A0ABZ3IKT7_9FIRM|nr:hypothetical protein [Sporomusa silvacetica]OZC22738.1 hypothetical protein SPSIL_04820 [Sporomusa silvacetica DSM 10669]
MEITLDKEQLNKLIYLGNFRDNSKENICHICLENKLLTREHIPPKSAFDGFLLMGGFPFSNIF